MKKIIPLLWCIILIIPWIYNYFSFQGQLVMEFPDELNISNLLNSITHLEMQYRFWSYTYSGYGWISYIISNYFLSIVFGKSYGIIYIILAFTLWYIFCYKLLSEFLINKLSQNQNIFLASFLSLVYLTWPSIFLYIQSTIALTIPAIIFPLQLYIFLKYNTTSKSILILGITFFLISFCNITTIIINVIFLFLFYNIYHRRFSFRPLWTLILATLPIFTYLLTILITGFTLNYNPSGNINDLLKEDFYSIRSSIFNILTQTSDWGFFGIFKWESYYPFSIYYSSYYLQAIGLIFIIWLTLIILGNRNKKNYYWIIIFLLIIWFMLGMKNPLYAFLYNNLPWFQILRNTQKFAPFLIFTIILWISQIADSRNFRIIIFLSFLWLIYNVPYFTYNRSFIESRIIQSIPKYWYETISFINTNLDHNSRILTLPAVYINESYTFGNDIWKVVNVSNMLDRFTTVKNIRLSPTLNGFPIMQSYINQLFIAELLMPYWKVVDIKEIQNFIKKYRFSHILLTNDVEQNFENSQNYTNMLNVNYIKKYQNQFHTLFQTTFGSPDIYSSSRHIFFEFQNYWRYTITTNTDNRDIVILNDAFHPWWKLYLEPYTTLDCSSWATTYTGNITPERIGTGVYTIRSRDTFVRISRALTWVTVEDIEELNPRVQEEELQIWQKIVIPVMSSTSFSQWRNDTYRVTECSSDATFYAGGEISKLWEKPIFDDTHRLIYEYANAWTIDPEYIKANYSKEYYHENPDGSIDIRVTLYFRPQSYFYLGIIISATTCIVLIGYLIYAWWWSRRRHNRIPISSSHQI